MTFADWQEAPATEVRKALFGGPKFGLIQVCELVDSSGWLREIWIDTFTNYAYSRNGEKWYKADLGRPQ